MLTRELWLTANKLNDEHYRRYGKPISRRKLASLLNISEQTARNILFAIRNKQIIKCEPAHFDTYSTKTELVFADVHIPYQDDLAIQTMFDYIQSENIKPDIVVVLGDLIDFYQISCFDKDPRRKKVSQELDQAKSFLSYLRSSFPDARIIYYFANHEERWQRFIFKNAKEIADLVVDLLPTKLGLKELNIEVMEEPFRIGKLWHLHGSERKGSFNIEYITNAFWKYIHDNFIVAHYHRTQEKIFKSITGKIYVGTAIGCLCQLQMDYAKLNNWNHGFAIVKYDDKGNFRIENKQIFNGEVF